MQEITINTDKGPTLVKVDEIDIPDLWHVVIWLQSDGAHNTFLDGRERLPRAAKEERRRIAVAVLSCWHTANALKTAIRSL
jgi:hypothetical protein